MRTSQGWAVRVEIPVESLGRLRLPSQRIRYRDGWVRLGLDSQKQFVVATLEDREGRLYPARSESAARVKGRLLGHAVMYHLAKTNKYQPGEQPGLREQIRVAL